MGGKVAGAPASFSHRPMQPAAYSIIPARETDAAEIARLSLELGYQASVEETRSALGRMLGSPRYFVVVASAGSGPLLGWAAAERRLSLESGESAEITGLVVATSARRLGVGRALVAAAEQWARGNGFTSIRVRSNVTRAESHPFYESQGFERAKTQHAYRKALSPKA
jgi:GNAT superfamily N-acetyltransferase